jgi:hypothetical protein
MQPAAPQQHAEQRAPEKPTDCLARLHSDRAVETDGFSVQHDVLEYLHHQRRKFIRLAETRRKGCLLAE